MGWRVYSQHHSPQRCIESMERQGQRASARHHCGDFLGPRKERRRRVQVPIEMSRFSFFFLAGKSLLKSLARYISALAVRASQPRREASGPPKPTPLRSCVASPSRAAPGERLRAAPRGTRAGCTPSASCARVLRLLRPDSAASVVGAPQVCKAGQRDGEGAPDAHAAIQAPALHQRLLFPPVAHLPPARVRRPRALWVQEGDRRLLDSRRFPQPAVL